MWLKNDFAFFRELTDRNSRAKVQGNYFLTVLAGPGNCWGFNISRAGLIRGSGMKPKV